MFLLSTSLLLGHCRRQPWPLRQNMPGSGEGSCCSPQHRKNSPEQV
ncbi:unnamed protein product, partial [Gulo gulo]